ncbi:MAG: hypothetical protein AVDCRST_MAG33-154, partial [uncultured Thermomicrobiales bacterium]
RRPRDQCRPDSPQYQSAPLAPRPVADRPRRGDVLPPHLERRRDPGPDAIRAGPGPRPAAVRRVDLRGRHGAAAATRPDRTGPDPGAGPGRLAGRRSRVRGRRRSPDGLRRLLQPATGRRRPFRRGGRPCPHRHPFRL